MIREDRELLAELARLNREMAALALRMMEGSASTADQRSYAQRLISAGERLERRARRMETLVVDGLALPADTIALHSVEQIYPWHPITFRPEHASLPVRVPGQHLHPQLRCLPLVREAAHEPACVGQLRVLSPAPTGDSRG